MRRRWARGTLRVLVALVAGLLAALGAALVAPLSARAEDPQALVAITVKAMDPALPARDGTITLSGRVKNITDQPISRPRAFFWRDPTPITDQAGLDRALASAANDPIGSRLTQDYQDLYPPDQLLLEPGRSVPFKLKVPVADLQLATADGIFLMGVHVLREGPPIAIGRARIFVPVVTAKPARTVQMTSIVTLGSRPSLVGKGIFSDDHLATEVAAQGRLTTLLEAARASNVSFAVDPALIEELKAMSGGYQVLEAGVERPEQGQADASRWLASFAEIAKTHDGYRLLYGSPDIAALVHHKQKSLLGDAAAAGAAVEETKELPLLVLPAGGAADKSTVKAAEKLDPAAIVLSDSSAQPGLPLLTGPGDAPVVAYGEQVFAGGPGPDPSDTPVHRQQRLLATTWLEATSPGAAAVGRVRLITDAAQVEGDELDVEAPWVQSGTLADLLRSTPARWDQKFSYSAEARAAELTPEQLDQVRDLDHSREAYAELLADPKGLDGGGPEVLARAASAEWRNQPGPQNAWLAPQQDVLDQQIRDGVEITTTPKVSTADQSGVEFPISIRNNLPASDSDPDANAVKLRLVFESDNPQRLSIKPITPKAPIRAGDNFTDNAEVTARANGVVGVKAQLETLAGTKVGRPVFIEVNVTQNGTVGIGIAVVAGVVFIGATALRIRRVTKDKAAAAQAEQTRTQPENDPLSSAPPVEDPQRPDAPGERIDA